MQNICEPELRHGNRGREDGKGKGGSKKPHALPPSLPPGTTAGWPPNCIFVTVNEARRYLATSIFNTSAHCLVWVSLFSEIEGTFPQ
jgi:hypothetical protein